MITFLLAILMNAYQAFAYERSLVRILYKNKKKENVNFSNVNTPKNMVKRVIDASQPHDYTFLQRMIEKFVLTFCCCCRDTHCYKERKKRNEAHIKMKNRLSSEVDV
jgi:hypothetical protein